MSTADWPVAISTANDDIATGVVLWRQRRQLFATVAVKATFTLVPNAIMALREPLPIERAERTVPGRVGVEPGDLAPCLMQPEVWVRGHAWHPPAEGAPSVRVRLAVAHAGNLLMRKSVEIPIQQNPFVPPSLHALAPLSRTWPVRTRLLGVFDWTNLDRSPIEIPDVFDWSYFQAAPADQRLEPLRGNEWIRLEAIHSTLLKFDTQLPSATSAIMMFGRVDPFVPGVPVRSGLDTIQIDADHGTCALVFRGHTPLPVNVAFEDLQFVAGLSLPDRPIPKLQPRWGVDTDARHAVPPMKGESSILETSFFDPSIISAIVDASVALPFRQGVSSLATSPSAPRPREEHPDTGQTFMLDPRVLDALEEQNALPFHESSSVSRLNEPNAMHLEKPAHDVEVVPAIDAPIAQSNGLNGLPLTMVPAPPKPDVGSTFFLSAEMLEELANEQATPFVGGAPAPERDEPVAAWAGLPFQRVDAGDEPPPGTLGAFFLAAMASTVLVDLHGTALNSVRT